MSAEQHETVMDALPTIGKLLRGGREKAGVTLEGAAEATKISRSCLRSLEADRMQDFSSMAYLKGFLRTYSEYLHLDPEEMLLLLEKQPLTFDDEDISAGGQPPPARAHLQRFALPITLFITLLVSSIFFSPTYLPRSNRPVAPKPVEPTDTDQAIMQPVSAVDIREVTNPAPAQEVTEVRKEAEPPPLPQQPHTDGFLVRMKVKRNCQLVVLIDGATVQRYDLATGDIIEWKAGQTITLDISEGDAVELERDGQPYRFQATAGKPAWVQLDAEEGGSP